MEEFFKTGKSTLDVALFLESMGFIFNILELQYSTNTYLLNKDAEIALFCMFTCMDDTRWEITRKRLYDSMIWSKIKPIYNRYKKNLGHENIRRAEVIRISILENIRLNSYLFERICDTDLSQYIFNTEAEFEAFMQAHMYWDDEENYIDMIKPLLRHPFANLEDLADLADSLEKPDYVEAIINFADTLNPKM